MEAKKIYGIRRKNFMYGDDYHYPHYDTPEFYYLSYDVEKIEMVKEDLEALMCKRGGPEGLAIENYIGDGKDVFKKRQDSMPRVKQLFKEYFNIDIKLDEHNNLARSKDVIIFPKDAPNEQINQIRELLQLNFFEIYEFDATEDQMSYEVKYNADFFPKKYLDYDDNECDYYNNLQSSGTFLNEENACGHAAQNYFEFLEEREAHAGVLNKKIPGFVGSLEQLSTTPKILESTLENMSEFKYDSVNKLISINSVDYEVFPKEFMIISSLLLNKPFEIIKTPLDNIPSNDDEEFNSKAIANKMWESIHIRNLSL